MVEQNNISTIPAPHTKPRERGRIPLLALMLSFMALVGLRSVSAGEVDEFTIGDPDDTTYLPYELTIEHELGKATGVIARAPVVHVLEPGIVDSTPALLIRLVSPTMYSDDPCNLDIFNYPPPDLVRQIAIRMDIKVWKLYFDDSLGHQIAVGAGSRHDTAWAFRLDPYTMDYEQILLQTGEDATGDGRWDPEFALFLPGDVDGDGSLDAMIHVNPVRDGGVRTMYCLSLDSLSIIWSRALSQAIGGPLFPTVCSDPTTTGLVITSRGPRQGKTDEYYDDMYSYLSVWNTDGTVRERWVVVAQAQSPTLLESETPGEYYLIHQFDPVTPDSFMRLVEADLVSYSGGTGFMLSRIDCSGKILNSTVVESPGSRMWQMSYGREHPNAIWLACADSRIRIFDTSLALIARSNHVNPGEWWGYTDIKDCDSAMIFARGLYTKKLKMLADYGYKWASGIEPMLYNRDGSVAMLAMTANNGGVLSRISKRGLLAILSIFYVTNRTYVLMTLSALLVGLIITNYYRRRTGKNLRVIREQKEELEKTHRALRDAQEQLIAQEKFAQAKDMAGGFAHEIRNALMPARYAVSRLLQTDQKPILPEKAQELTSTVSRAIGRAVELTGKISGYTKLEETYKPERVDPGEIIRSVLNDHRELCADRGITATFADGAIPTVVSNRGQLTIVFVNIIGNAIDALEDVEDGRIDINWTTGEKSVRISVADTGCGVPPENLDRVTDFFFSTKPEKGTGMGLALVKKIVEMYGGSISVTSEDETGTCITVGLSLS